MLSERMRARLAELNREPLPTGRDGRMNLPAATATHPLAAKPTLPDEGDVVVDPSKCGREVETPAGRHWLIERPVVSLWPPAGPLAADAESRFQATRDRASDHPDWAQFARAFPRRTVFLDLETCGFAGSMVFLTGLIHDGPDGPTLSQLLARNYAEEAAMLSGLWERMAGCEVLVTFNGKSFDWPMVQDRSILHRLRRSWAAPAAHLDLLHHARRRYRRELPNCKLQTLEWYFCGRRRSGDIPGSEIPDAYHRYVRTGDDGQMRSILHHNALDLVTLLQLSLRLAAP